MLAILTQFSNGQVQLEPACAESVEQYGVTGYANSRYVWSFDHEYGEVINGEGSNTITIHWGYQTGTIDMEVLEITDQGCYNFPSQASIEIMAPDVNLGYDFPEICDQDTLVLSVGTDFYEPFEVLWQDGSTNHVYAASVTEQIWARVIDGYGCIRYDTISLLVNPLPEVYIGRDTVLCDETMPVTLTPGDFAQYEWHQSASGAESYSSYLDLYPSSLLVDTVTLTITDYNQCRMSDTLLLYPCDLEALFRDIPNTITPDGDGVNDIWNIPYMDFFEQAELEVFDNWGRLVYRTTNVQDEPWDGTSGGRDLPMDAYYYVLNLNMLNVEPLVGTVHIIR
ncbi:MAG: gliding motility-associated C-terminal domain-containing protein [Bacteroidales bacterium]|nr:gliding motility-associated C-terminal domain-containing protein [Bacteroidales bacterium]